MEQNVSSESSLRATLMVHVHEFERCHDCTDTLVNTLLSVDLVTEFEKQQIQAKPIPIERNR